ncbi:MAG: DUF3887 domain-containing protein [Phascolarctobacterium sp.]|uniref:DUF3887 domain-containing protein n=1 Tax=Phascolarctobacterium sp. TaxID=2049039 RepID=UPI0026DD5AFB|nr:DUF3887 domain-containing protein [Phascolarctobacterium sp.]MDO4921149.1 DUF3887 domain-containing protein [Phascolarctobacterium sp.]
MKKYLLILTAIFTMAFSGWASAADGGDLNKQQAAAQVFINAFGASASAYTDVTRGFGDELKSKVNADVYAQLQQQVDERFGTLQESKFYSFQRFDNMDQVTYIASFSKEKLVSIVMAFDKKNKLTDFALTPIHQQEEKK